MSEIVCVKCNQPIREIPVIDAEGYWYHTDCMRKWLYERLANLEDALRPFAECWNSPEPKYPLEEDYKRAADVLKKYGRKS
jgi:hypothetical protein